MDEMTWHSCADPLAMLAHMAGADAGRTRPQARLFRLYACGVCRTDPAWPAFRGRVARQALATCEWHADADASAGSLPHYRARRTRRWELLVACAATPDWTAAALGAVDLALGGSSDRAAAAARCVELVHEVFGNPYDPLTLPAGPPVGCPTCRGWDGYNERCPTCKGTSSVPGPCPYRTDLVAAMARTIYAERAWGDLPILADALEEAGCPQRVPCPHCKGTGHLFDGFTADLSRKLYRGCPTCKKDGRVTHPLLAHLRGPGPHVRGCHALDLLATGTGRGRP